MTRAFSREARQVTAGLVLGAGSGLHSVIREPGVTCEVCGTPLDPDRGFIRCYACKSQLDTGLPLADRVGSLVYALEGDSQVYKIVQNYKAAAYADTSLPTLMSAMLALGMREHYICARTIAGIEPTGWAVVPSTRGRTKLRELVLGIGAPADQEIPIGFTGGEAARTVRPEAWGLTAAVKIPAHVMLVDDSWVTGSNAQGVASMLKGHGVQQVSVLAVARVMRPSFGPNPDFIRTRLATPSFRIDVCPWTGADCA